MGLLNSFKSIIIIKKTNAMGWHFGNYPKYTNIDLVKCIIVTYRYFRFHILTDWLSKANLSVSMDSSGIINFNFEILR